MLWMFVVGSACHAAERGELTVSETAGIRRFSYPVQADVRFEEPPPEGMKFRLLHEGEPLPAQFRITDDGVSLDFDASFLPQESRTYEIEYGDDVAPLDEPPPGMHVAEHDDHYLVKHTQYLAWKIPKTLRGFLDSVTTPDLEFVRPASAGFVVKLRDRDLHHIGIENSPAQVTGSRIAKQGPIQCELEFDVELKNSIRPLSSRIRLSFPRSKSWVLVEWTIEDTENLVEQCGIDVNLNVVGTPTLVDFGAGSFVYAPLAPEQSFLMKGVRIGEQKEWVVLRGPADKLEPYVVRSAAFPAPAEGWAHVMDKDRCTAISVADFGDASGDTIQIDDDGRTQITRGEFKEKLQTKSLKVWYHFVTMPVHVGAATSPQSMLVPLKTAWKPR